MTKENHMDQPRWDAENIDKSLPLYTIGMAARLCEITVHTIRMYEQKGLVLPFRSEAKQRLYSQNDVERLRCIRRHLTEDGLNIAGIKAQLAMTPCWLIRPCALDDYKTCAAYTATQEPCWAVENKGGACDEEDCRVCPVYQLGTQCGDIKALYKNYLPNTDGEGQQQ